MTDAHQLEWHTIDDIAKITVSRDSRSHLIRQPMATGDETGSDELRTRALAVAAFENLEAERRQSEEAAQRRAQRADP